MFNKKNWFYFFALISLFLAFYKIAIHLNFSLLPVFFIILGFISYLFSSKKALYIFFFFLPLINSIPDFFSIGYPFNYMGIPLFYLSGIIVASLVKKERLSFNFNWSRWYLHFIMDFSYFCVFEMVKPDTLFSGIF